MNKKFCFVLSAALLVQAVAAFVFAQNDYVDLGLSVQWATCNLGADKPQDYGYYYAWAETEPKKSYTWENYRYYNPSTQDSVSKYHIGEVTYQRRYDYIGTLTQKEYIPADMNTKCFEPMDDAATSLMGNDWRMPTADELWELKNLCEWQYINRIDSCGYIITSKVPGYEGHSIFLPAAGYKDSYNLERSMNTISGGGANYWTSTLGESIGNDSRWNGNTIRPVMDLPQSEAKRRDIKPDPVKPLKHAAQGDLGLSVRWADCNVGADIPEERGARFAWVRQQSRPIIPG